MILAPGEWRPNTPWCTGRPPNRRLSSLGVTCATWALLYSCSRTAVLEQWPATGVSVPELSLLRPLCPTVLLLTWDEHIAWSPGPCRGTAPRTQFCGLPSVTHREAGTKINPKMPLHTHRAFCYINRKLTDAGSQPWVPGNSSMEIQKS